jgi:2-methylisocitrate lyase-like PEP mutase family enzyme
LEELNIDICARTDGKEVEGLDKTFDRAKAFIQVFFSICSDVNKI